MRSTIIKKTIQEKQQNQTTITTSINYIQNFRSVFFIKKIINEVKIVSGKTETTQNNLHINRKEIGPLHNKAR